MSAKKKSKTAKRIIWSVVIIAAVGIGILWLLRPQAISYESVVAKMGDITTYYSFSGNVEAKNRQTVISEKVMQISDIAVEEGDKVKEGDLLLTSSDGDEITADIDGEIAKLYVEENAQVMAGMTLVDIVDYENLEINVKVDEYDIGALSVGKETTVKIGAADKELGGTVSAMSKEGTVANGVAFFIATIDLDRDESIRVGMSAEVTLVSESVTGVVTLPMSIIQFDDENHPYVLKEDEKGNPVRTEITVGVNDGTTVEITDGVAEGETVLYPSETSATGFARFRNASAAIEGGND